MIRKEKQTRSIQCDLKTRAEPNGESEEKIIEGYFAVFNKETELFPGGFEEIASNAFDKTLGNDIRALINHDTSLVLGRNKVGTLYLNIDTYGLYGRIKINEKDTDAINLYERVKRGDVDQCSFGFFILDESTEYREDGSAKWTLNEVDLYEVSVCTFPAYEETGVTARSNEMSIYKEKQLLLRKNNLKERLKNGTKTTNTDKEN
ncbi:MAG: HK97 family phage prohead protease [Flavobacterium sp.]